jgi:hypothetical protein
MQPFSCSGLLGDILGCNLNLEIFAEKLGQTRNSAVCPFSVIENTIAKVRFNDESFMF